MKIVGLLGSLLLWFCVGTVLAQGALLGVLWSKGFLSQDRVLSALAAWQGLEIRAAADTGKAGPDDEREEPSYDEVIRKRAMVSLDLDLRESAIDKSLGDLRNVETQIKTERERLDGWKQSFDDRLATLQTTTTDAALQELQRTLEAIAPKQAKDQILHMLDSPANRHDKPMRDVVSVIKAMPLDKRKKIFAEFKSPQEMDKLAEILQEIRLGTPDSDLIRDARGQLQQQLNPQR
jgi:hypothetical protein